MIVAVRNIDANHLHCWVHPSKVGHIGLQPHRCGLVSIVGHITAKDEQVIWRCCVAIGWVVTINTEGVIVNLADPELDKIIDVEPL